MPRAGAAFSRRVRGAAVSLGAFAPRLLARRSLRAPRFALLSCINVSSFFGFAGTAFFAAFGSCFGAGAAAFAAFAGAVSACFFGASAGFSASGRGFLPHLLFRDFRLRLVCFDGGPVYFTDGLLQRRVSPFLVCKAQARFLTHTSHPPSGHPAAHRFPHIPESEWFLPERPLWTGKAPSGFLLPCPDPESGCP